MTYSDILLDYIKESYFIIDNKHKITLHVIKDNTNSCGTWGAVFKTIY